MILTGAAKVAGVMGWPVAHSLSPRLHGWWLHEHGIDGAYVPLAVRPEDLATALRALPKLGLRGVNLTLPHKQAAVAVLDELDSAARRVGAVNTIVVSAEGRLLGSNTDGFGFLQSLKGVVPNWRADAGPAVLLGAGGAARALAVALLDAGVPELRIVNRDRTRAQALAEHLARFAAQPVACREWEKRDAALEGAALLVNATSLGMRGQPPLALSLEALAAAAVVVDIVYTPLETALLREARRQGHRTVDGLGMLLHQGIPGFTAWFGAAPQVTAALRRHMQVALQE